VILNNYLKLEYIYLFTFAIVGGFCKDRAYSLEVCAVLDRVNLRYEPWCLMRSSPRSLYCSEPTLSPFPLDGLRFETVRETNVVCSRISSLNPQLLSNGLQD
jgi:hypothetical protein